MNNKSVFLFLLTILMGMLLSCNKDSDNFNPKFKSLDLPPLCSVFNLSIDQNNNKWIATDKGLIKYTNKIVKIYKKADGLASDTIGDVAADKNGNVWCVTLSGISQFNGTNFITHRPTIGPEPKKFHPGYLLVDNKNNLWMCTRYGLCRYDGKSWESFEGNLTERLGDLIGKIQPDPENESNILIFIYPSRNIIRFNGTKFEKLDSLYGEPVQDIRCITRGNNGKIYFGVDMKGMMIRKEGRNTLVSIGSDFRNSIIHDIKAENENQIWVGAMDIFLVVKETSIIPTYTSGGFRRKIHLDTNYTPWITGSGMVEVLIKY